MTLEELLECSAATLAAMTDEELMVHFAPLLNVTRPDPNRPKPRQDSLISPEHMNDLNRKIEKLKALGIDVDKEAMIKNIKKGLKK